VSDKSCRNSAQSLSLVQFSKENYGASFQDHLLEQYKLYVESAERVSDRRLSANNYLLTVNASIIALYGLLVSSGTYNRGNHWLALIPAVGILVSLVWYLVIDSYRKLNSLKFEIIHELEQYIPAALYCYEWEKAGRGCGKEYRPLTHLERWVPVVFVVFHGVLVILGLVVR